MVQYEQDCRVGGKKTTKLIISWKIKVQLVGLKNFNWPINHDHSCLYTSLSVLFSWYM